MKIYFSNIVFIPFLCISLTACVGGGLSIKARQAQDGCKMSFKKNGGFSISGIEIPTTRQVIGTIIKIGNITYNADEAYELTETAQVLEQVRLTSCALINSEAFISMPSADKKDGFKMAFDAVNRMTAFGDNVKKAKNVDEALDAAAQAKKELDTPNPTASIEGRLELLTTSMLVVSNNATDALSKVITMNDVITQLRNDVDVWRTRPQPVRIEIVGFPSGATSLPSASRDMLFSKVNQVLSAMQEKQGALLLVVGYADLPGTSRYNIELGLRRAQNVVEILQRQSFSRTFESKAVSGGVDTSANGRHVKIFVLGV